MNKIGKVKCECTSIILFSSLYNHKKTKKHINYLKKKRRKLFYFDWPRITTE
jgi:hypothetical protein